MGVTREAIAHFGRCGTFRGFSQKHSDTTVGSTRLAKWTNSAGLGLQPLKANGYTDDSKKWQATPKPLREIIDDYNSRTKEQQGPTLAMWMRDPEKSKDIASMIEQHRENTRDRGMSR